MRIADIPGCRPAVMGILNVTPDSFSDGGLYFGTEEAVRAALDMVEAGTSIIDVGGESTRPGAAPVEPGEEWRRVIPVIRGIRKEADVLISCDTSKPEIAEKALEAGADMINDVTGFSDPAMRAVAASHGAGICIMHMKGTPRTMQEDPSYGDLLNEIRGFLYRQAELCVKDGIPAENIVVDPGIGFGKDLEHNLEIIANAGFFARKYPVMIGASRKSFLGMLLGGIPPGEREAGTLAVTCWCALKDVSIVRVHDASDSCQALKVLNMLKEKENE